MEKEDWVLPGVRLAHLDDFVPGPGTFVKNDYIFSSLVGQRLTYNQGKRLPIIEVSTKKEPVVVPQLNSLITAKVIRVNPRFATLDILCVGNHALKGAFRGIIRHQDVRATEIDKVEIYKSFRPGDIVLAQVISLGDSKRYYLSTAKNELGVIFATSGVSGRTLVPISWEEMQCPVTKTKEFRKVVVERFIVVGAFGLLFSILQVAKVVSRENS